MLPYRIIVVFLTLAFAGEAVVGQQQQLTFARGLGMGGANLCLEGAQGLLYNPGALGQERSPLAFAGAAESFGKAGIRNVSAGVAGGLPFGTNGGLGFTQSSNVGWRQTGITVALCKRAGLGSIGGQVWLHQTAYFEAARYNRVSFNIGGVAYPLPSLRLAAAMHNLGKPELSGGLSEPSPVAMQAGLLYMAGQSTLFAVQADKFGSEGVTMRVGVEHKVIPALALRIGASQNPGQIFAGMGLQLKRLHFDYGFGYHPVLGARHSVGLSLTMPWLLPKRVPPLSPDCLPEIFML